jgi:uroporphyrin-III C-methyltransferase
MGMNKLDEIISIYQNNRKDDLPVAIIQNGTKLTEKKVLGNISTIIKLVKNEKMESPAIIIIGEVVKNAIEFSSYFCEIYSEDEFILQNLNEVTLF